MRRLIDVDQAKALIFSRLRVDEPGPEYVHFPMSVGETFFDELTAEKLVTKRNKFGVPSKSWVQTKERNESLDCFVLALAALRILAPTPARFDAAASRLDTVRRDPLTAVAKVPRASERPRWLQRRH